MVKEYGIRCSYLYAATLCLKSISGEKHAHFMLAWMSVIKHISDTT
jgi:hypothetical protein